MPTVLTHSQGICGQFLHFLFLFWFVCSNRYICSQISASNVTICRCCYPENSCHPQVPHRQQEAFLLGFALISNLTLWKTVVKANLVVLAWWSWAAVPAGAFVWAMSPMAWKFKISMNCEGVLMNGRDGWPWWKAQPFCGLTKKPMPSKRSVILNVQIGPHKGLCYRASYWLSPLFPSAPWQLFRYSFTKLLVW